MYCDCIEIDFKRYSDIFIKFFQNAILGEKIKGTKLMKLWPYLLFELYKVHTSLVANAVPQLELKLKVGIFVYLFYLIVYSILCIHGGYVPRKRAIV